MKKIFVLSGTILFLTACGSSWTAIRENRLGVADIKAENPAGAVDHFVRGLGEEPFRSEFHHNLGFAFDLLKKPEEAEKSYRSAEKFAAHHVSLFVARFNLAEGFGRAGKVNEAIEWYQKALEVKPDSVEAKTNIELLIKSGGGQGDQQQKDQQGQGGDSKDQKKDSKGNDKKDQDKKDQKQDQKDQDKDGKDQKDKKFDQSAKYKPRPFKGDLSEGDVKKILGEIRQQEQRIRAEYNRKDAKERPRDKDW